jgi:hypothetical protein
MAMTLQTSTFAHPAPTLRRMLRYVSAAVCAVAAVLYLTLFFMVRADEMASGVETTYGAYLFLFVPYAVGAVLLARVDLRLLWGIGAIIQLAVVGLYLMFGTAADLSMAWGALLTGLQVGLLALLAYLALTPAPEASARPGPG